MDPTDNGRNVQIQREVRRTGFDRFAEGAFLMAAEAHHGPRSHDGATVDHPVAVAELLHERGFDEEVVAAALLHDVVEDSTTEVDEIRERFGPEVARLVAEMTEDAGIERYEERKAEHRARVRRDPCVAAIYAADKLANTRELKDDASSMPESQVRHYLETLRTLRETRPELPFLDELEGELNELVRAR